MEVHDADGGNPRRGMREAVEFWEWRRIWYNAILIAIVALWVVLTWPHFRPAMNLSALGKMCVLAVLANLCYCAAYVAELLMQPALPHTSWRRVRIGLFVAGMLIAIVLSNYWIADEIYPDVQQGATALAARTEVDGGATGSNMNFPAPLAVLGFLGACGGFFVAIAAAVIFWFARKASVARRIAMTIGVVAVIYFAFLLTFSATSHEVALARGQEKYFCEIDCHLAYSVVDVKTQSGAESNEYAVTLRTRFDETTTSPSRPKDAPLTPSPREVMLLDGNGHRYAPVSSEGSSLITPLAPAESYLTQLRFRVPKNAGVLRLLINTVPAWPDRVLIGDENSWLHKKTYFAL